jgi:predicted Zn-dependent peptidase
VKGARRFALAAVGLALGCTSPFVRFVRPAWELPPPPARDAPVVPAGALHRSELPNGLRVIALEDHRLPRVAFGVTVRRGAASEALGAAGLSLFLAELMERGAGDRDALALAQAIDQLGASLSVSSGWDATAVGVSGLARDLDALFALLGDVVLRPRLDAREGRRVRDEMLAALEQAKDEPEKLAGRALARALYPDHRYGLPLEGKRETVERLDAAAARELHRRLFVPEGAILWAAGDFDLDAFLARASEVFGGWARGPELAPGPPPLQPAPPERRALVVDRPDLEQARIALGHEGIARADPDRVAVALMNELLGGGGFSSRLMESLRAEAGLTYAVGSSFVMRRAPGPFAVSTFTRVAEARRTLDLALAEIERFRREPPGEAELQDARALAVGEFSLGLETSDAVIAALVDLDVYGLPEDSLDTYRARVRAVGPEQIAELARRLLHPERAAIVLVGPAEVLRPQLEGLGPIEVVAP